MKGLEKRFREGVRERNCRLIRYGIIVDFRNLYNATKEEALKSKALELTETGLKYKKKCSGVWKKV